MKRKVKRHEIISKTLTRTDVEVLGGIRQEAEGRIKTQQVKYSDDCNMHRKSPKRIGPSGGTRVPKVSRETPGPLKHRQSFAERLLFS